MFRPVPLEGVFGVSWEWEGAEGHGLLGRFQPSLLFLGAPGRWPRPSPRDLRWLRGSGGPGRLQGGLLVPLVSVGVCDRDGGGVELRVRLLPLLFLPLLGSALCQRSMMMIFRGLFLLAAPF
jgi:hypothetical protein